MGYYQTTKRGNDKMIGRTIMVWLGAFGPSKDYGPQPGDAWIPAVVMESNKSGSVMAERCGRSKRDPGGIKMIPAEHWREMMVDDNG